MSWKFRTDALVTAFSSFHDLGKLDRTSAVVSKRAPMGKWLMTNWPIRTRVLSKLCYNVNWPPYRDSKSCRFEL